MNFFGHATVASWIDVEPAFVLGAMLPDFSTMLRVPLGAGALATDGSVQRGIALHHATDAVFHALPGVLSLMSAAHLSLESAGLERGPARAVAHIGTELLLDEVLSGDARARDAYLSALGSTAVKELDLGFERGEQQARFVALMGFLLERGPPRRDVDPELVAMRLERALAGRPRLALLPGRTTLVREWILSARPAVRSAADGIVRELRERLFADSPAG